MIVHRAHVYSGSRANPLHKLLASELHQLIALCSAGFAVATVAVSF